MIKSEMDDSIPDLKLDDRSFIRLLMYFFDCAIIINIWFLRYQMLNYKYSNRESGSDGVDLTLIYNKCQMKEASCSHIIYEVYSAYRATAFLTILLMMRPYGILNKYANQFEPNESSFIYGMFKSTFTVFEPDEDSG